MAGRSIFPFLVCLVVHATIPPITPSHAALHPTGTIVRLTGIPGAPAGTGPPANGLAALVTGYNPDSGRYVLQVQDGVNRHLHACYLTVPDIQEQVEVYHSHFCTCAAQGLPHGSLDLPDLPLPDDFYEPQSAHSPLSNPTGTGTYTSPSSSGSSSASSTDEEPVGASTSTGPRWHPRNPAAFCCTDNCRAQRTDLHPCAARGLRPARNPNAEPHSCDQHTCTEHGTRSSSSGLYCETHAHLAHENAVAPTPPPAVPTTNTKPPLKRRRLTPQGAVSRPGS
jgi:hypothetical protein